MAFSVYVRLGFCICTGSRKVRFIGRRVTAPTDPTTLPDPTDLPTLPSYQSHPTPTGCVDGTDPPPPVVIGREGRLSGAPPPRPPSTPARGRRWGGAEPPEGARYGRGRGIRPPCPRRGAGGGRETSPAPVGAEGRDRGSGPSGFPYRPRRGGRWGAAGRYYRQSCPVPRQGEGPEEPAAPLGGGAAGECPARPARRTRDRMRRHLWESRRGANANPPPSRGGARVVNRRGGCGRGAPPLNPPPNPRNLRTPEIEPVAPPLLAGGNRGSRPDSTLPPIPSR